MRIVIFGANGQTGRLLTRKALDAGHTTFTVTRHLANSGLFDLPYITEYVAGEVDPVGTFTSRNDLADYPLNLAGRTGNQDTVTISTVADTPTMWQMIRREAFKSA